MYTTLISVDQLQGPAGQRRSRVMVFDCSFELMKPEAADAQYARRTSRAPCSATWTGT